MCTRLVLTCCVVLVGLLVVNGARADAPAPPWAKLSAKQVAAAKTLGVPVAIENSLGMRFVLIPAGTFMMGSRDSSAEVARRCAMPNAQAGWFHDEHPRHEVRLTTAFYMSIHEVTQACYDSLTPRNRDERNRRPADEIPESLLGPDRPVVKVSWEEAKKFCESLGRLEGEQGRHYTLPTEAQWEYAARGNTKTPFAFGETVSTDQANYHGGYIYAQGQRGPYREKSLPVGSLAANAWGLFDMHGNVAEWCTDRYGHYSRDIVTDPMGPDEGNERVVRGGSWRSYPGACRSALRLKGGPTSKTDTTGFRVCLAIPIVQAP